MEFQHKRRKFGADKDGYFDNESALGLLEIGIDLFYAKELGRLTSTNPDSEFKELTRFLKIVLCLPHGNAMVERGFR